MLLIALQHAPNYYNNCWLLLLHSLLYTTMNDDDDWFFLFYFLYKAFCSANARRQVKSVAFLLHVTVQSEQEHLDKQFQHKTSDTMFHALNERAKGSGARHEDYDPANAYFTALAEYT